MDHIENNGADHRKSLFSWERSGPTSIDGLDGMDTRRVTSLCAGIVNGANTFMENVPVPIIKKDPNWFSVSNSGWRRLNAGRDMGHLVREAISNIFDVETATKATVQIQKGHVLIEDDSPLGFATPELIFTIFLTDKEDSITKRGRKGRGLKELISAADKATVESVGTSIRFEETGRIQEANQRQIGTKVEVWSQLWQDDQIQPCLNYLRRLIPPANINLSINGQAVVRPTEIRTHECFLETVNIVDGVQRTAHAYTKVTLFERRKGEKESYLYEMGIPVQVIPAKFHMDVQQRIPMNDNRDNVSDSWLNRFFGKVLDGEITHMSKADLGQDWIQRGAYQSGSDTQKRFVSLWSDGKQMAIKVKNKRANDVLKQRSYELLDLQDIPESLRGVFEYTLEDCDALARKFDAMRQKLKIDIETDQQIVFTRVLGWVGTEILGKKIEVGLYQLPADITGWLEGGCYSPGLVQFNVSSGFDLGKPLSPKVLSVMVHELAHDAHTEHDEKFHAEVERIAGQVASLLWQKHDLVPELGKFGALEGKSEFITCCDCGAQREVKVQDLKLVKRCLVCQKKHQREQAAERKREAKKLLRDALVRGGQA